MTQPLTVWLKQAAERATPGPWNTSNWADMDSDPHPDQIHIEGQEPEILQLRQSSIWPGQVRRLFVASTEEGQNPEADAAFIALANPQTILALCASHEALVETLQKLVKLHTFGVTPGHHNLWPEWTAAWATAENLIEQACALDEVKT